jgi:hypothetical protein
MRSDYPERTCNGGPEGPDCGKPATVVATRDDGLSWYACDQALHQLESIKVESITDWFDRIRKGR